MSKTQKALDKCLEEVQSLKDKLDAEFKNWESNPVPLAKEAQAQNVAKPKHFLKRQRTLDCGKGSKISAIDWAADSQRLVTASQDGKIIVWNAFNQQKESFIMQHSAWFMTCKYSPDKRNSMLGVGGLDNCMSVYKIPENDTSGGADCKIWVKLEGHDGYVGSCAWNNNAQMYTGSGDATIKLWDVEQRTAITTFRGHQKDVNSIDVIPGDENLVLSGSGDGTARLWDRRAKGNHCVASFPGHQAAINAVKFFPGNNAFGAGGDDCSVRLFDLRNVKQLSVFLDDGHDEAVTALDFSQSGQMLLAGHSDGDVVVWSALTGDPLDDMSVEERVTSIKTSPDGKAIAVSARGPVIDVYA
jgi:WD40 repeat protein